MGSITSEDILRKRWMRRVKSFFVSFLLLMASYPSEDIICRVTSHVNTKQIFFVMFLLSIVYNLLKDVVESANEDYEMLGSKNV